MSERNKPHNGRDVDGHYKVKQADVDDLQSDPNGVDYIRDDVRLGGAVADIGAQAGQRAAHIHELVEDNRENVDKLAGRDATDDGKRSR
jgi:hypothetical protein